MRTRSRRSGFTLIELLVVISIVLLTSIIAMSVLSTLNGRQITDAARIFTGGVVGARDSAIKYNEPRGIRLLPDPTLTIPALGAIDAGTTQLVYNRYIPIEPAGDYSQGKITIGPQLPAGSTLATFPPRYPRWLVNADRYPFAVTPGVSSVLMVEESPVVGGFATRTGEPNSPTNWYWNIRVGDKIKIGGTGRAYTIVGPCSVNPWKDTGYGLGNVELFVNVGPPGTTPPLVRQYYSQDAAAPPAFNLLTKASPEFLFVVNGEDDVTGGVSDGYVDSGWDGYDNDVDGVTDELDEWEAEKWTGAIDTSNRLDNGTDAFSPTTLWINNYYATGTRDSPYIINRRPVPSPGAREVMLPVGTLIDATTWNSTKERSRIPVSPGSLYCDIMVNPSGRYIPTTEYSSPTSASPLPFLHFWLATREDVYPVGTLPSTLSFKLPMTSSALGVSSGAIVAPTTDGGFYPGSTKLPVLKGDRRLVTMFAQSGLVTVNEVEPIPPLSNYLAGEGFNIADVNYPFIRAQQGLREAR